MNTEKYTARAGCRLLPLYAGIVAALCWTVADVLLVGFVSRPADYPLFHHTLRGQLDTDIATLMLPSSPERLLWGVLPATFSLILYWFSLIGVYRLLVRDRLAVVCIALLCDGYALAPLAHAGFFYVGISAQTLLHSTADDLQAHVAQFNLFYRILTIHWFASVILSACGWLLLFIQTLRRQTVLPRYAMLFNPLPVTLIIGILCSFFPTSSFAAATGGASMNLAQMLFFITALMYSCKAKPGEQGGSASK